MHLSDTMQVKPSIPLYFLITRVETIIAISCAYNVNHCTVVLIEARRDSRAS